MKNPVTRFVRNRRGAIAIMFALALLPLVMLVGLSIDYSFYTQARAQFTLAGDAAAAYAIREATATYTLESYNGNPNASADAVSVGETAGQHWFTSQLATLPTTTISGSTPTVTVTPNQKLSPTNPAGFTATVSYRGIYPPFFNHLFGTTRDWYIDGTSGANSQYSYVEVLVMMDTSASMLVSADPAGVTTMDDNTVCIPSAEISDTQGISGSGAYDDPDHLVNWSQVNHIVPGTSGTSARCNDTRKNYYYGAFAPCAFACHTTTNTVADGNYGDLYGMARRLGVQMKTDVVFNATESVIKTMITSHQVPGQFTVGVYQFNDNACPIVTGNTASGDALAEATGDLTGALSTVDADDYNITPNELNFPPLVNSSETDDFTNFPQSVADLISGHFSCLPTAATTSNQNAAPTQITGTPLQALPPPGTTPGSQADYPEKNIFIITDGMGDTSPNSACGRYLGEITSIKDEETGTINTGCWPYGSYYPTAVCQTLKNLGFTVYVLDVAYPSVVVQFYYQPNVGNTSNANVFEDFPALISNNGGTPQLWNETSNAYGSTASLSPDAQAMQACASSPNDFFQASSASDITNAMALMLKSALDSATRITE